MICVPNPICTERMQNRTRRQKVDVKISTNRKPAPFLAVNFIKFSKCN